MAAVSIIIPVTRRDTIDACLESIGRQDIAREAEVILVSSFDVQTQRYSFNIKKVSGPDINSAKRRNDGAAKATAAIMAFIDDDVVLGEGWLKKGLQFFADNPGVGILGGPDIMPKNAPFSERISDALLKAPLIGSGVLAHMGRALDEEITSPSDLALCNVFIRKDALDKVGGFNEKIGYICEDTEFFYIALKKLDIRAFYKHDIAVFHRRRSFPIAYIKQRFVYRVKNGRMIFAYPEIYLANAKMSAFLAAGTLFFAAVFLKPAAALVMITIYFVLVFTEAARYFRDSRGLFLILFAAFPLHHAAYFAGMLTGLAEGVFSIGRLRRIRRPANA